MRHSCIRYLMDLFLLWAVSVEADLVRNRKSSMILFYGNIRCTRTFGTLWCMSRQCVSGPLFRLGDEAKTIQSFI